MIKYVLYLGLNDKNTKKQEVNTLDAYKIVSNLLLKYTDGATIFEARGIYKHDDGTFVVENTLRIELLFVNYENIVDIVEQLKTLFNQESIAVSKEEVTSQLL